jgi:hypothetical protein
MKSRTSLYLLIVLDITALGGIWLFYLLQGAEPTLVFPAAINRDCAPWDGTAFTVSIPMQGSVLDISIFQSPAIRHPVTFSLDEKTIDIGDAYLLSSDGSTEQLTGKVFFRRLEEGIPVEGGYHFRMAGGEQLTGRFKAEWGNEIVYCG